MASSPEDPRPPGKAEHGSRNEVNWDEGRGAQPYANQPGGPGAEHLPGAAEAPEGDRGRHSGENLEQLDRVKRKP